MAAILYPRLEWDNLQIIIIMHDFADFKENRITDGKLSAVVNFIY